MNCPKCGGLATGQIGRGRYYCGECCIEWIEKCGELSVYRISEDGTLVRLRIYPIEQHCLKPA